jgi:cyclic beta-1,2-glucan synthetase
VSPWDNEEVLREELFSIERLEQHAASLALAQPVAPKPVRRPRLSVRLSDNESVLLGAYRAVAQAVGEGRDVTPAAEWLLDNFHLVEGELREVRRNVPTPSTASCPSSPDAVGPARCGCTRWRPSCCATATRGSIRSGSIGS